VTTYKWKITEVVAEGGILKRVKFWCRATNDKHAVETEGNWTMRLPFSIDENTPESQVIHWLDLDASQEAKHLIKYRLQEQLDALGLQVSTKPPWAVETFKVTI
jgi:hypothetical protein